MAKQREPRTVLNEGGGPPPGYRWSIALLPVAFSESQSVLRPSEYRHMRLQFQVLAREQQPTHSQLLSIDAVEDFYELRDRGSALGNKNVRAFWGLDKANRTIVILGVIVKQNNGPTPLGDKVRMRNRWRNYERP